MLNNFDVPEKIGGATVYNVTPVRGGDAYLFVYDDVTFLFDSGYGFSSGKLHENIKAVLGDRPLDYVLLTHSHYDHALGSAHLSRVYPDLKVVSHEYAAKVVLKEGARKTMMRLDEAAKELNGFDSVFEDIENLHIDIPVVDGQRLMLGSHECEVISLPGHTRDSIGYYFAEDKLMLGCETIGIYAKPGVVMPSFLVGYQMSLDSIERCESYDIKYYMIPHQGVLTGDELVSFFKSSTENHISSAAQIVEQYKAGKTVDDIREKFAAEYYPEEIRNIYPPAAFLENVNIQIPLILKENGLIE